MAKWFGGGPSFDDECRTAFQAAHLAASRRELESWMQKPEDALSLVILLDQIPRNIYRGSALSYATDGLALHYANLSIKNGFDKEVGEDLRSFFYMPFEHSEELNDQHRAVELMGTLGNASLLLYAEKHRDVILKFGRFPHRNAALGRTSTPEEIAYLEAGGGF